MASSNFQPLKQKEFAHKKKRFAEDAIPLRILWGEGNGAGIIEFMDGKASHGSCIHCVNPPCMEYATEELADLALVDFPAHPNQQVCPTGAIQWPVESEAPFVNPALCIFCGLCASRCPIGAIRIDPIVGAVVNDEENTYFTLEEEPATRSDTDAVLALFRQVPNEGMLLAESDAALLHIYGRMLEVWPKMTGLFPYLLTRNLLIGVGIGSAMRRPGDVSIRMDLLLGPPGVEVGTATVELGVNEGILDAPRNMIDNVAVLVSRYEINKERIVPLIISFQLPNKRTEYWQVIQDIKNVLGLQIGSVTVGLLIVMVWARFKLKLTPNNELYTDSNSYSLRSQVEQLLGRTLHLEQGYPGFIESPK